MARFRSFCWGWGLFWMLFSAQAQAGQSEALRGSQQAIGRILGEAAFVDSQGQPRTLTQWRGKPLVISLIYTSCFQICSLATRHLAEVVNKARAALGSDSFVVLTIGFDTPRDTPKAMAHYAKGQQIEDPHWFFLSADRATLASLTEALGFTYQPSPKGFDHIVQATVVDEKGEIYRQVYGETFETPLLVEPLKDLVLGRPRAKEALLEELTRRVRFFCTTYDAATGRYRFDYTPFMGMAIGLMIIGSTGWYVWRERRRTNAYWRQRQGLESDHKGEGV